MTCPVVEISVSGWTLDLLDTVRDLREQKRQQRETAEEAADLLLSMRLGCLCTTRDLHIVRCEKHRLADLLEKMCDA